MGSKAQGPSAFENPGGPWGWGLGEMLTLTSTWQPHWLQSPMSQGKMGLHFLMVLAVAVAWALAAVATLWKSLVLCKKKEKVKPQVDGMGPWP